MNSSVCCVCDSRLYQSTQPVYTTHRISSVKKNINYHFIQKSYKITLAFAKKPLEIRIYCKINHKKSTYRTQS